MVIQNSTTVLVGRYTRSSVGKDELYQVSNLILVTEVVKLILSTILEEITSRHRQQQQESFSSNGKSPVAVPSEAKKQNVGGGGLIESIQIHIVERPTDALKTLVPALLYMFQNSLYYVALSNLTAPVFQVTYQGKLVTTALVSVSLLNRRYSLQQWICIVTLSLGVAVVVLDQQQQQQGASSIATNASLVKGLTAVTMACFSSAMAGVYFEKVVKAIGSNTKHGENDNKSMTSTTVPTVSVWMRNIQLAFFTICTIVARMIWQHGMSSIASSSSTTATTTTTQPFFHGFTGWVWLLVFLQAGGGMLVAAVIKYADNVLKGLATGVSVCVATVASVLLLDEGSSATATLNRNFFIGASMILSSVYFFSNPLSSSSSSSSRKKNE